MLVVKNKSISLPWELTSIFMEILPEKILLYWPPPWPPCHVVANQDFNSPWDKVIHWRSLNDAIKFERPQIHFLATFSLLSSLLNFPNLGLCQFTSHPWCNVIYSSSLFYGLLSGLGSLLRMFCFLCFTPAVSNKLYHTGDEPNLPSFFFVY